MPTSQPRAGLACCWTQERALPMPLPFRQAWGHVGSSWTPLEMLPVGQLSESTGFSSNMAEK